MLKKFYSGVASCTKITAEQGSLFAKEIAGDFNPLHDVDAKRFCVPGDLLFAIVLEKYGLSQTMNFQFTGMLGHGITLDFPDTDSDFAVKGSHGKTILQVNRCGNQSASTDKIAALIREYVAFSGGNFPYVLVPLMQKQNAMINISRPLVMYDSMHLEFSSLDFDCPKMRPLEPKLIINGKRGTAHLHFAIESSGKTIATGYKKIIIGNIRDYQQAPMQDFVDAYLLRKKTYLANK